MTLPPAFARLRELERDMQGTGVRAEIAARAYFSAKLALAPRLLDALEIAVEALEEFQWGSEYHPGCPSCGSGYGRHNKDCAIQAALARIEALGKEAEG